jgi:hypothetical protein
MLFQREGHTPNSTPFANVWFDTAVLSRDIERQLWIKL